MAKNGNGGGGAGAGAVNQEKERMELPLAKLPNVHPCASCGQCCAYIAVEIDNPTSFDDYDHMHWYLTHRGVSVYVDWGGDWFIEFQTVCEHLSEAKTCGIYEERPKICSDFSWNECEKTTQELASKYRFTTPQELLDFMQERRPRNYERYMKEREKLFEKRRKEAEEDAASAAPTSKGTPPAEVSA